MFSFKAKGRSEENMNFGSVVCLREEAMTEADNKTSP